MSWIYYREKLKRMDGNYNMCRVDLDKKRTEVYEFGKSSWMKDTFGIGVIEYCRYYCEPIPEEEAFLEML